jgi:hypothetical protein
MDLLYPLIGFKKATKDDFHFLEKVDKPAKQKTLNRFTL